MCIDMFIDNNYAIVDDVRYYEILITKVNKPISFTGRPVFLADAVCRCRSP